MPTALVLSSEDLGEWSSKAATVRAPGGSLPYGIQHLRHNFTLTWSDAQLRGIWRTRPARAVGEATRRGAPGLRGYLGAVYAMPLARSADVVLSVFENVGLGFARFQGLLTTLKRPLPHIMLTCWLAEDLLHMSPFQIRSVRRSLESISGVAVFSANQIPILQQCLALDRERIGVVPFGVDTEYYDAATMREPGGGSGLIAVGGDRRRDYSTLVEAVRIADVPLTLVCYPRNIAGLDRPPHIKVLFGISHDEYRRLLHSADLVVTPTVAPAYPSGQSVVLEAMSMGKATLTTDSSAMRDYITDGVNGVLVPPRAPAVMAELIRALLTDGNHRHSIGLAAAETVRERFGLEQMWKCVSKLMTVACTSQSGSPR